MFLPKVIEIEPTNYCNLKYKMCHLRFMKDVEVELINIDTLAKSLRGIENKVLNIGSVFEPTIHPNFSEILEMTTIKNEVSFISNLTDQTLKIIQNNKSIYWVQISLDSVDKKIYENIRKVLNMKKYYQILINFYLLNIQVQKFV